MEMFGIPNCDKVKKARSWLDAHKIAYTFHDYKKEGVSSEKLKLWSKQLGWENLLNTSGTTWRNLPEEKRHSLTESSALQLMLDNPSIIRRPLIETGKTVRMGFDEADYRQLFFKAA